MMWENESMNMLSIPLSFSNGKGKTLIEGEDEYYETLLTRILNIFRRLITVTILSTIEKN